MPIKSFLAFPSPGKKDELSTALSQIEECVVTPSTNEEVLVLVTDTTDKKEEEQLLEKIQNLESCDQLSMVAGYSDNQTQTLQNS